MLAEVTPKDLALALDATIDGLLAEADCREPPVDALAVARAIGLVVALDARQSGRARFVRLGRAAKPEPMGSIFVRPEPRHERLHWAVAHEIGEHACERVFALLGIHPHEAPHQTREAMANQLASRLLMPTQWFGVDAAACDWDLLALKTRYVTASHEMIARRMLDFEPSIAVTVFDQARLTWRRSNIPGRAGDLSAVERECWSRIHESARPSTCSNRFLAVQGWPVHEDAWKREILRTLCNLDSDDW